MSGKQLRKKAKSLSIKKGSKYEFLQKIIVGGFLNLPQKTDDVIKEIRSTFGRRIDAGEISIYMKKFMGEGIIRSFPIGNGRGNIWVLASMQKEEAMRLINKDKKTREIEEDLFSDRLLEKLEGDFEVEFNDLRHNLGKSGTCTAFLLRKILEKLIYLGFAKNGIESKLEDKSRAGGLVGLETMINIASSEKIKGIPFLMPKTAKEIKGMKFLGDTAAHNPLINIDMKTIVSQMPYIITAYEELAKKL